MEYASLVFVHLAASILWAGGAITAGYFVIPSVLDAGAAGGAVMAGVLRRKFPVLMNVTALLTLLSGVRLYMLRFSGAWLGSAEGIVLSAGGLLATAAFFMGMFVQRPTAERMGALGAQLRASGAPPTPEQAAELAALGARLGRIARLTAGHLLAAALLMALHRIAAAL